ncbi:MAG TPA: hypothetical protein DF383_07020 [Deltaproteobacteria bacterium]|nr:hypothetical protein [Deltaproteobacteria bacterium]
MERAAWLEFDARLERAIATGEAPETILQNDKPDDLLTVRFGRPIPNAYLRAAGAKLIDTESDSSGEIWQLYEARFPGRNSTYVVLQNNNQLHPKTFWIPPWIKNCRDALAWIAAHPFPKTAPKGMGEAIVASDFSAQEQQQLDEFRKQIEMLSCLTKAVDRIRIEDSIRKIYAAQGYDPPQVLWAEGPMQALLLFGVLSNAADGKLWPTSAFPPAGQEDLQLVEALRASDDGFWSQPGILWQQIETQLGAARAQALTDWRVNLDSSVRNVTHELDRVISRHATGVQISNEVHDMFFERVSHHWPRALEAVKHWMPPPCRPLSCADLHCPGERFGWQGGPRPEWSLCDRAYEAVNDTSIRTLWWEWNEWLELMAAIKLGVVFHPIHDELIRAWSAIGECSAAIFRCGLAICAERPIRIARTEKGLTLEFADGVRLG